jgi:hypothetical protein
MKTSNLKIFEKFNDKTLNKSELVDFENRLKENSQFKAEFDSYNELIDALEYQENKRLSGIVSQALKSKSKTYSIKPVWLIAASIALIAGLSTIFWPKQKDLLFDDYFSPYEETNTQLGAREELNDCIDAYNKKEYTACLDCLTKTNRSYNTHFYMGMSYLNIAKYEKAIDQLKIVQAMNTKKLDESSWYLALLYIKLNKKSAAKLELNKLINNKLSNYKKTDSKSLLEKI